jgi:hypothetical protein
VGLLNPNNLWLALSLAALIAIYLRSRARPTLTVSSLMLFESADAPVRSSRLLRIDALFWIEAAALSALTLAAAGLYIRTFKPLGSARNHALIFDVGAAMDAEDGSRIGEARRAALAVVNDAPADDRFSVITYALEARVALAPSSDKDRVRQAIGSLRPLAVTTRRAALHAALIYAVGADSIQLFTDHPPPSELLDDARRHSHVAVRVIGHPADNLALVALEPGIPKNTEGRCLVRNFSFKPQASELEIDVEGHEVFDSSLIVEPRGELAVRFGPLPHGGLLRARLKARDGLAADNQRFAIAPSITSRRALVISPDANARDDLARILLALNPPYRVTAVSSTPAVLSGLAHQRFDLIIAHDTAAIPLSAPARLFVFPPTGDSLIPVSREASSVELQNSSGNNLSTPLLLGVSRVITMPGWMEPVARGVETSDLSPLVLAAVGQRPDGAIGYLAFDIRHHLLLDPDHLDALLLAIKTIERLVEPSDIRVTNTGEATTLSTFGPATLIAPDGTHSALDPDSGGRVRVEPFQAGQYEIISGRRVIKVYANYYDEAESDLAVAVQPASSASSNRENSAVGLTPKLSIVPQSPLLISLVLLLLMAESVLMIRRSHSWI